MSSSSSNLQRTQRVAHKNSEASISRDNSLEKSTSDADLNLASTTSQLAIKRKRDGIKDSSELLSNREFLVYSFGDNSQSQLMFASQQGSTAQPLPTRILKLSSYPVLCLACGDATSYVVSDVGGIWGGGSNVAGLISLGTDDDADIEGQTIVPRPCQLGKFAGQGVRGVAAGAEHCIIVFENGAALSFGTNEFGQLGHGPDTESLEPRPPKPIYKLSGANAICQAACGRTFTLLLTKSGELFACGDNSHGCLGVPNLASSPTAEKIPRFMALPIVTIAAGSDHCLALTLSGKLYVWGRCRKGQLGIGSDMAQGQRFVSEPLLVEIPSELGSIKAVVAGGDHSLLLMSRGAVMSTGENTSGQCGVEPATKQHVYEFRRVDGLPVDTRWLMGSAGRSHSVLVSSAGQVWTFGRNVEGQLGIGHFSAYESNPQRVVLPDLDLTCFAYGCAAGSFFTLVAAVPIILDPAIVNSCVQKHSLLSSGELTVESLASRSLQEIMPDLPLFRLDSEVRPAKSSKTTKKITCSGDRLESLLKAPSFSEEARKLWRLPSIEIRVLKRATPARANFDTETYHAGLSAKEFLRLIELAKSSLNGYQELKRVLMMVFSSATRLNCSFLLKWRDPVLDVEGLESVYREIESLGEERTREIWTLMIRAFKICIADTADSAAKMRDADQVRWILICMHCPVFGTGILSQEVGSTLQGLVNCVLLLPCASRRVIVRTLAQQYDSSTFEARIVRPARHQIGWVLQRSIGKPILEVDDLWAVMLFLQLCYLANEEVGGETRIEECGKRFKKIPEEDLSIIIPPTARINPEAELAVFENWIRAIRAAASTASVINVPAHTIPHTPQNADTTAPSLAREISFAETASTRDGSAVMNDLPTNVTNIRDVTNEAQAQAGTAAAENIPTMAMPANELNVLFSTTSSKHKDKVAPTWKYDPWRAIQEEGAIQKPHRFFLSHCNLLPMTFKKEVFARDAFKKQVTITRQSVAIALTLGQNVIEPYFVLTVNRQSLVADAMKQVAAKEEQWLRPLKVIFQGEEGVDEGGLKREFFRLVMKELLSPKYQLFDSSEDKTCIWFLLGHQALQLDDYRLVGALIGLAVYNDVRVSLNFPPCLYRKLLDEPVDMSDFEALDPVKAQSFKQMLEAPANTPEEIEEFNATYGLIDFTYPIVRFGESREIELVPDGKNVAVSIENRQSFVDLTVDFVLNTGIKEPFEAFKSGMRPFFSADLLTVINSRELEMLITGSQTLDFEALKRGARYVGGYSEDQEYIKEFWKRICSWDESMKRKFLLFCTGTDRSPIGGLEVLNFTIQRNGAEPTSHLPTSHTCFNLLLLPQYSDADKMERLLRYAVEGCEGFGLR